MPHSTMRVTWLLLFAGALLAAPAAGDAVSGLAAVHRQGQTFLTWQNLPGSGWIYRVYTSPAPITQSNDLVGAALAAIVRDSSAFDRRLSQVLGEPVTFRIDSAAAPLSVGTGLCVVTPVQPAVRYYAVTAQQWAFGEDVTIVPGDNALLAPVTERLDYPEPVWQRSLTSPLGEVWAMWTTHLPTALFPAMCNQASRAYHLGLVRGSPGGALVLHGHGRGGNLLNSLIGTGRAGEWVISIDDYLLNGDQATWYMGYHPAYDIDSAINPLPAPNSIVHDYTDRRVIYLADWAERRFGTDPDRLYAMGVSMGASMAFFLAAHHPDRIAAAWGVVPKMCFGFLPDAFYTSRQAANRQWGFVEFNIATSAGPRIYDYMDGRSLARSQRAGGFAPMIAFSGRNDSTMSWNEKIPFYAAIEANAIGGTWFWDNRNHTNSAVSAWAPMQASSALYRHRLRRSYPALSHCSANEDPGDGTPASGDSVGVLNGHVGWDTTLVDEQDRWEVLLHTEPLTTRWGPRPAADSLTVDVTPRRVQRFLVADGISYTWTVSRLSDGAVIQSGTTTPDSSRLLTAVGVKVMKTGSKLRFEPGSYTSAPPPLGRPAAFRIALGPQPFRGDGTATVEWPGAGPGEVTLHDVSGRRVRSLWRGEAGSPTRITVSSGTLAPGIYLLSARHHGRRATARIVLTR